MNSYRKSFFKTRVKSKPIYGKCLTELEAPQSRKEDPEGSPLFVEDSRSSCTEIVRIELRFYAFILPKNHNAALANALYKKGPVLLSVELVNDIRNSGLSFTEDLICVLIGSWGRLGLAKYCAEIFGQISFLADNCKPDRFTYNILIQVTKGGLSRFLTLQCNGPSGGLPVHLCHTICSRYCTYYLAGYAGSVARKIKQ
ncbi:hypothetical protein Gotur_031464 [Gossypium turneri]